VLTKVACCRTAATGWALVSVVMELLANGCLDAETVSVDTGTGMPVNGGIRAVPGAVSASRLRAEPHTARDSTAS
jgi:hypothetical protein